MAGYLFKGCVIIVGCKRCGCQMLKWDRGPELEAAFPFKLDSICGACITRDELYEYRLRMEKNREQSNTSKRKISRRSS